MIAIFGRRQNKLGFAEVSRIEVQRSAFRKGMCQFEFLFPIVSCMFQFD